eukprot:scaffold109700_cov60-Phaeocystis_antarctica.AAC.2
MPRLQPPLSFRHRAHLVTLGRPPEVVTILLRLACPVYPPHVPAVGARNGLPLVVARLLCVAQGLEYGLDLRGGAGGCRLSTGRRLATSGSKVGGLHLGGRPQALARAQLAAAHSPQPAAAQ